MKGSFFYYALKLLRPRQWIKNFALFAAPMFGGLLFAEDVFYRISLGFIAFCLLSSATYIVNDLLDAQKDRLHPFKKMRPIASGHISTNQAIVLFTLLISCSFFISFQISVFFVLISILYLILQLSYSLLFKSLVVFDILFIAAGYILRVLAGEVITGYHISVWLLLTTVSLSLFLAVGKRRSELTLLRNQTGAHIANVRKSLSHYSDRLLDAYSMMFATTTLLFYSMFTFLESTRDVQLPEVLLPEFLPDYLQRKWLMVTILPVIYGVMRYLQDIYEKSEGESPDRVLLSDKALLAAVVLWGALVIFIIYVIG
ncbi:MAG: decaprenyl-phosphate phosphoribosyltransferase [Candidatus Levybacteria bacterium]|nr:decaprenyl-phosphate phosphoribosyltransferase [Candidatus Levybacteria bacterium]